MELESNQNFFRLVAWKNAFLFIKKYIVLAITYSQFFSITVDQLGQPQLSNLVVANYTILIN